MYSKTFLLIGILLIMFSCEKQPHYEHLTDYPVYEGSDLGFTYTESATHFRLWSPAAKEVRPR